MKYVPDWAIDALDFSPNATVRQLSSLFTAPSFVEVLNGIQKVLDGSGFVM